MDEASQDEFIIRFLPEAVKIARSRCRNQKHKFQDAESVAILTLVSVVRTVSGIQNLEHYVRKSVCNRVIHFLSVDDVIKVPRGKKVPYKVLPLVSEPAQEFDTSIEEELEQYRFNSLQLKLIKHRMDGYTIYECAELLGLSSTTTYRMLTIIRERINHGQA